MFAWWRSSIRLKLMGIIMLAVTAALFLAGIVFVTYQLITTRRATAARLAGLAQIIGTNSAGALSFNDRGIARKTLSALTAEPDILAAKLFDREGQPFAHYARPKVEFPLPDRPGKDGVRFEASRLVLFQPIVLDSERIGTIFLVSGLEAQNALLRLFFGLVLGVIGFGLVLALGLSSRLQRRISSPILELTRLARQVSENKDYSPRAAIHSADELGQLADGFNQMLARIQAHETELGKLNRKYRMQSGCNQAVVRAKDEHSLLGEMCLFLRKEGGYPWVEISYREPDEPHRLLPIAQAGEKPQPDPNGLPGAVSLTIPLGAPDQPLGSLAVVASPAQPADDEEKTLLIGLANDLTYGILTLRNREQRKKAENELNNAQLFLANVIESMPSMLISVHSEGIITQWNDAATRVSGIPASRALGRDLWEILPSFTKYRSHVARMIETRRIMEFQKEILLIGGEKKFFNVSLFPLVTTQFTGVVIRADDVTESERKDSQLRQSQKMETIGTLAGGLAHDFNNVLAGIIGTLSLLRFKLERDDGLQPGELPNALTMIEASANRAADMVQHLLALSRKQELSFVPMDLNMTIQHVMEICRNTFDKSVELLPLLAPTPAMISSDPTQMEQVLLNLCLNAAHAMTIMRNETDRWGGKLTVSLEAARADAEFCRIHPEAVEGNYWHLAVSDQGVGIAPHLLTKVFDPFFTTKSKEKGSGLGLAMAYNIVHQHKGFIDVHSEVAAGTTFHVFLPALEEGASEQSRDPGDEELPHGQGLILVVDDEPMIRQISREALEACGYSVILAENGQQGVDLFRERHDDIVLVLLDMNMPKKSGREACVEIKQIDPRAKVVMVSGFRNDDRMAELLSLGVTDFMQKPYTMKMLASTIHKALRRQ